MACIRILRQIPETYEDLSWKFLEMLPSGYKRVDIVVDTYQDISIKSTERSKRGSARKIIIRSEKSKIPQNFNEFLKIGENKARMIELIVKVIKQNVVTVLTLLDLEEDQVRSIIVRSPSGDIDIIVIMIGLRLEEQTHCFLDTGSGNNRKGLWLSDMDMSQDLKQALIGFHSFTGNDYTSSFFRKGKVAC